MYLDHKIIAKISRMLSRINMNVLLLDNNGQVILPEDNKREFTLPDAIRANPNDPLVYGGFTLIGTEGSHPLFLCLPGDSVDVSNCAILCASMINMITKMDLFYVDKEQAMRSILREEIEGAELESISLEHNIPFERNRCIILCHLTDVDAETALNILCNVIVDDSPDIVVEVDRHTIVLIKTLDEQDEYEDMRQFCEAIDNTFVNETSHSIYIGIGEPKRNLALLAESYREARKAIDVGRVYKKDLHVFEFRKLLLERFLADIPRDMCSQYNALLFNRKTARLFNDEMIHTIEKFFENNLNLSETARQLYIHRNTLVYRLDKVQRIIGLDLRAFDDAVTFKMMMLLGKTANDRVKPR